MNCLMKPDPASQQTLRSSTLAKAIATLYTSISTSRIAHIELTTHLSFSLQIPIPTSISQLPDPTAPQLPGLWLTTATSIPSNDDLHTAPSKLASHFALLLLTDLPSILTDIATTSSSPLTGPLTHYLRHTTPTKSFLQISQSSGIPLNDIHFLASHLIYWRRARAVPPLHQRDIYIVSPNADMRKLRSASTQYAKLFPALPTLPKMLSMLSGSPKPYGTLIPSKDHKAAYIEILAWLMRGGWVTQLRTFAWVRVPGRIQAGIARELENEKGHDGNNDSRPESSNGGSERGRADTDAGPPDRSTSRRSSASSARTAIPLILHPPQQPRHTHNISNTSSNISQISSLSTYPPKLILHPNKASALESRWLDFLSKEIEEKEGKEIKELWISCLKYFNGEHALEKIAIREGWKRKRVEALRATWGKMGILVEVRHW